MIDRILRLAAIGTSAVAILAVVVAVYSSRQEVGQATAQEVDAPVRAAETEFNTENRVPVEIAPNGEPLENHVGSGDVPQQMVNDCQTPQPDEELLCALILAHDSGEIEPGYYTDSELKHELDDLSQAAKADLDG